MSSIGYSWFSSYDQWLDVQLKKLSFCDTVFQEKQSARTDAREQLQRCLNCLQDGDSLVITKLDRLARSTCHLLNIMSRLDKMNVKLVVLDQQIDTSTPTGMLFFTMLGAIATFENDLSKVRQFQGVDLAMLKGFNFVRKHSLNNEQINAVRQKVFIRLLSITSVVNGGRSVLPAGALGAISPNSCDQGTTKLISSRNSRMCVSLVTSSNQVDARLIFSSKIISRNSLLGDFGRPSLAPTQPKKS